MDEPLPSSKARGSFGYEDSLNTIQSAVNASQATQTITKQDANAAPAPTPLATSNPTNGDTSLAKATNATTAVSSVKEQELHSLQGLKQAGYWISYYVAPPYVLQPASSFTSDGPTIIVGNPAPPHQLYHSFIQPLMAKATGYGDPAPLFQYLGSQAPEIDPIHAFGSTYSGFNEQSRPFSVYNWELGLHGPMTLINQLLSSQQFEQALSVCHYVFNPMAAGDHQDMSRFWQFTPFKSVTTQKIEDLFLRPNTDAFV
jgi:hypothetical protein